jgi:hypothetical protein
LRVALVIGVVVLFTGSFAVGEQHDAGIDLSVVEAAVTSAEAQIATLDQLIAEQELKLDALYVQKDAAAQSEQNDRAAHFNSIIDQMNLTLTNLEAERDSIAASIATLRSQIAVLRASAQNGIEE